ncbi:MAG: hypothetical protein OWQ48_05010 [Desulfurococcus sp.]|nr:hypothetical protein [Desulfurococcus sp.]
MKKIQRDLGITTILVTHDQADAFAVGDRIVVIHKGKVIQVGEPKELYEEPADLFIASFIGDPPMNILDWSIVKSIEGLDLIRIPEGSKIGIRPDEASASVEEARAKYRLKGTVEFVETAGSRDYAIINVSGHMVKALVKPGDSLKPGDTAHIALKRLYIFSPDGSRIATLRE